ncbi:15-hydroxyprostaglandin dehydrogenase [Trichonephila clavipes]|nr:15-hydroxyprostaglandin dehydrogenase [Trichonephila clavipes]
MWVEAMRPLEVAGKNGWAMTDFSVMMVAVDLGDEFSFQLCPDKNRRRVWRRPGQRADPAFTIARHRGPQERVMYLGLIFQQYNAKPRSPLVAMNSYSLLNTSLASQIARSLSNRACLGYDGKADGSTNLEQPALNHVQSDTMTSAVLADPTRALQGTNKGSGPAMEESKNDVGCLEQLLLYADEHYLAGKLPLGHHI